MTHVVVFNIVLALTCCYAWYRGGAPERMTAVLFVLAAAASFAVPFYHQRSWHSFEPIRLTIDVVMLGGLMILALCANRYWPLYVAALHIIGIAVHGVKVYQPDLVPWMYHAASGKIAYPMLILLTAGVIRHRERVQRFGDDRDWSSLKSAG